MVGKEQSLNDSKQAESFPQYYNTQLLVKELSNDLDDDMKTENLEQVEMEMETL